jgi:hypothetical protein
LFRLNVWAHALRHFLVFLVLLILGVTGQPLLAQRVTGNLPDAPVPKQQSTGAETKNKNSFASTVGVISRRSFFFPDLAASERPLSAGQKFELAVDQSIAPSSILVGGLAAGIEQADNSWPGYGQGAEGYGKRFGATMALNSSANMFGTFLLPAIAHHDPRYFVTEGGFKKKVGHAIRRVLLTRTDSGGEAANWSGLLGIAGAEGLANTYLPDAERTAGKTFQRIGIYVGVVAGGNVAKEFWPVVFKSLGGKRTAARARQADLRDNPAKP